MGKGWTKSVQFNGVLCVQWRQVLFVVFVSMCVWSHMHVYLSTYACVLVVPHIMDRTFPVYMFSMLRTGLNVLSYMWDVELLSVIISCWICDSKTIVYGSYITACLMLMYLLFSGKGQMVMLIVKHYTLFHLTE